MTALVANNLHVISWLSSPSHFSHAHVTDLFFADCLPEELLSAGKVKNERPKAHSKKGPQINLKRTFRQLSIVRRTKGKKNKEHKGHCQEHKGHCHKK